MRSLIADNEIAMTYHQVDENLYCVWILKKDLNMSFGSVVEKISANGGYIVLQGWVGETMLKELIDKRPC
jgi:hypothetical protein